MLIIKRKIGESVIIGDVEVIILGKDGKQLTLGIEAPRHIPIQRPELCDLEKIRIKEDNNE